MIARIPLLVPSVALAAFLTLTALVTADWAPVDRFDVAMSDDMRRYGHEHLGLIDVLRVVTDVAATLPFVAAGIAATAFLLATGRRRPAYLCAWVTVLIPVLWGAMHWLLTRPRPQDGFVLVDSNGFPSGHTSHATAAGLVAVLLLWPHLARAGRIAVVALAVVFAVFIGATRVILLAHWPTDVLGGWLLAFAVVPLVARALSAPHGPFPADQGHMVVV
ncbi:phosphatase PAP2 family protein [Phytohabitans rumicis]|uniref:phosphatase PAP2 family protein n=1 Tax=Phytohabitans rumicis TaxID=1076125 RepID=UPI0031E80B04